MSCRGKFSAEAALRGYADADRLRIMQNYAELGAVVSAHSAHFTVRDDSRLAFLHCTGQLHPRMNTEAVAHELMCIQHICDAHKYHAKCDPVLKCVANQLKQEYRKATWTDLWGILASVGCDAIKYDVMDAPLPDFAAKRPRWSDLVDEDE